MSPKPHPRPAPSRPQSHPSPRPPKRAPLLAQGWRRQIIQQFRKFTAALCEESSGGIKLIGGWERANQRALHFLFFAQLCGARSAARQVRIDLFAFLRLYFIASIKHQQRSDVPAARQPVRAHRSPPSCVRSLRVARNSEFFTVSSVVPSASPIARSLRP